MRAWIVAGALGVLALAPARAQAQSAEALQLRQQAEDVYGRDFRADEATRQRIVTLYQTVNARTSRMNLRANPLEGGHLLVTQGLLLAASAAVNGGGQDKQDAWRVFDAALALVTKQNAPAEWARGAMAAAMLIDTPESPSEATPQQREMAGRLRREALAIFTKETHPFENVELRCAMESLRIHRNQTPDPVLEQRNTVLRSVLAPVCGVAMSGQRTYGESSGNAQAMRSMTLLMLNAMDAEPGNEAALGSFATGDKVIDMIEGNRAAFLNASMTLDGIGLAPDALARARALRARVEELAGRAGTGAARRANAQLWRARADLLDILLTANPPRRTTTAAADEIVLAPVMLASDRGFVAMRAPGGRRTVAQSANLAAGVQARMPDMSKLKLADERGNLLPGAIEAAQRAQLEMIQSMQRVGDSTAANAWMARYGRKEFPAAIAEFRRQFEPTWSPLFKDALVKSGVRPGGRIVVLPDGAASMLPLALLRDRATGRALVEDYEVVFAPSLAAYDRARRRAAAARAPSMLAFAPPAAVSNLPGAENEVRIVQSWFTAKAPAVADKAALNGALAGASYWHFATHGSFNAGSPMQSGLFITPQQTLTLADLVYAPSPVGAPRLVVLSACETGLFDTARDPDDFIGLPTGFIEAGAAGVIASLWEVSDLSTTLLMGKFYERHVSGGERPSAALRSAQLWLKSATRADIEAAIAAMAARGGLTPAQAQLMRADLARSNAARPYEDPYYWGAFVYYGA